MREGCRTVKVPETDPLFARRVEETFVLLERRGIFLRQRNPRFVEYWVGAGETPEQIVAYSGCWSSSHQPQQRAHTHAAHAKQSHS